MHVPDFAHMHVDGGSLNVRQGYGSKVQDKGACVHHFTSWCREERIAQLSVPKSILLQKYELVRGRAAAQLFSD